MTDSNTACDVVGRRIGAFLVDFLVLTAAVYAVVRGNARSRFRLALGTAVGSALLGIPYHVMLEGHSGQTVGKRLVGVTVRRENGDPCTVTAAGIRTGLRAVDWLPAGYLAGFLSMALSDERQRIGDRCAGTVVVETRDSGPWEAVMGGDVTGAVEKDEVGTDRAGAGSVGKSRVGTGETEAASPERGQRRGADGR